MKSTKTNHVRVAAAVCSDCHQPLSWNGQSLVDDGDARCSKAQRKAAVKDGGVEYHK
jgi:hypothetical protein